jgi:xanthine dehydrogenase accessory factor
MLIATPLGIFPPLKGMGDFPQASISHSEERVNLKKIDVPEANRYNFKGERIMKGFYEEVLHLISRGERLALAKVVATRGSTPREVGAKMLVRPGGEMMGTIGGGCGEAEVRRQAIEALEQGQPRLMVVDLTEEVTWETERACGGVMEIFIDLWGEAEDELAQRLAASQGKEVALVTTLKGDLSQPGRKLLIIPGEEPIGSLGTPSLDEWAKKMAERGLAEGESRVVNYEGSLELFLEVVKPSPTLLIAGAGHIALPLAQMGALLDFRVVVIDDRPTFANPERFPQADQVIAGGFEKTLQELPIDKETYIVIITRGHAHDMECLRQLLGSPAAYIGMIGSRRRVKGVFKLLKEEGYSEESIARVHAPIGLDIGAKTPAEIALAIMGEIIRVRRGGSGRSLSETEHKVPTSLSPA